MAAKRHDVPLRTGSENMFIGHGNIRIPAMRLCALLLGFWLMVVPQAANSNSLLVLFDEYGAGPAPILEEEVKHACNISWTPALKTSSDHLLQFMDVPVIDPYSVVEHGEVAVPPPKTLA